MSSAPCLSERTTVKNVWLLGPDGELLERYACEWDAQRAARDFNATGRAAGPAHYARLRKLERRKLVDS